MTLRSRSWPAHRATVTSSDCPKCVFGCQVVNVAYTYSVNGDYYGGADTKPFLFKRTAQINAKGFSPGKEITVRVNPDDPSASIFRYS